MGGHFDIATKLTRIEELNDLINQEGFWNAQNDSVKITQELSNLKELVNQYQKLESDLDFCLDNFEIIKDDLEEITNIIKNANKTIESLENELYLKLLCLCYKQLEDNRFLDKRETLELMNENFRKIAVTNLKISVEFKELSEDEIKTIVENDKVVENIDKAIEHLVTANHSWVSWMR